MAENGPFLTGQRSLPSSYKFDRNSHVAAPKLHKLLIIPRARAERFWDRLSASIGKTPFFKKIFLGPQAPKPRPTLVTHYAAHCHSTPPAGALMPPALLRSAAALRPPAAGFQINRWPEWSSTTWKGTPRGGSRDRRHG
jgi:hypothetical protein